MSSVKSVESGKKPANPNRALPRERVIEMFHERIPPALHGGLVADRAWMWWSGDKPSESERALLIECGWNYTKRDHLLPDGRIAYWYHACGGFIKRTGRGKETPASEQDDGESTPKPATRRRYDPLAASSSDATASLLRLAASFG